MKQHSSSKTSDEDDEYPEVTQADLDRATFRVGFNTVPRKQRISIVLDSGILEYYRAKGGGRGYQALINDTLKAAITGEDLEATLRRIVREELRSAKK